jgi:periplasmic protein TonB
MSANLNIFNDNWLDTVFEGRNKSYGAYELRQTNGKVTLRSLLFAALFFGVLVAAPIIYNKITEVLKAGAEEKITKVELKSIKTPEKEEKKEIIEEKVEPVKETKSIVEVVKFVPPVIVDRQTVETPPPTVDDIKDKKTGASDVKASDDATADLNLDGSDSNQTVQADNTDYSQIFESVEVSPEPPGGINAFRQKVGNGLTNAIETDEESFTGEVMVRFVVMEDGSLDQFSKLKETPTGYGLYDKAVAQIKKSSGRWKPGEHNGRKVKVAYKFPLKFNIGG